MNTDKLPSEWVKGLLPFAVLSILSKENTHGYQLIVRLREAGLGEIRGGTVYPLLARLEESGLVSFAWKHDDSGPAKKIFTLTATGTASFERLRELWPSFSATIQRLGDRKIS